MKNILKTQIYNSFYYDYLSGNPKTTEHLPSFQKADWLQYCEKVLPESEVQKKAKKILIEQNSDLSSAKSKIHIDNLSKSNSVLLITGQQLGLFASPLYKIYKAITTVKLTDELNSQGFPYTFIPVFWLESEDHDFQEVNHFGIWDKSFVAKTIQYSGKNLGKASLRHYQFNHSIVDVLTELKQNLIETEFSDEIFELLQSTFTPGASWLEASHGLLKKLFHDLGLLFFQPGAPEIKALSVEFFNNLLDDTMQFQNVFQESCQNISKSGYINQVPFIAGKTFIHIENENLQREHLYNSGNQFYLKDSNKSFTLEEVKQFIKENPEKISTSVISRTLLQSWLYPTVCYVAGPGEIAYWAQLKRLFEKMRLVMPVVYPRATATLIEPKISRYIQKSNPDIENIQQKKNEFIGLYFKQLLERQESPINEVRQDIARGFMEIKKYLKNLDPTLLNLSDKTLERIQHQIDYLENKSIKTHEQKEHMVSAHLEQIHNAFYPDGQPQERFVSIVYFINKFGSRFFKEIVDKIDINVHEHQLISIDK